VLALAIFLHSTIAIFVNGSHFYYHFTRAMTRFFTYPSRWPFARHAIAIALAWPAIGAAQTAVSSDATTLAPITVTGAGVPVSQPLPPVFAGGQVARGGQLGILGNQDIMDVPFSISSYTAELIDNQQARTLGDVMKNDASVQVSKGFGNQAEVFVVRGFALGGEDLSFNGLYGVLPRQILSTPMMDRVEVFRGASAFLNGVSPTGTGIGGMINIVPKRAGEQPLNRVSLDYTSRSQTGGAVDIGRRWGASNQFGIRVNAATRDGEAEPDDEVRRSTFGSLGLDYRGDRLRASLDVGYQKQYARQPRPTVQIEPGTLQVPDAPSGRVNYGQPWTFTDLETTFGMARVEYDLTDDWTTYAAFGGNHNRESGSYSTPRVNAAGVGTSGRLDVPYNSDTWTGEIGVRGRVATGPLKHTLNVSANRIDFQKASASETGLRLPINLNDPVYGPRTARAGATQPVGNLADPFTTEHTRLASLAISDTVSFWDDRVALTAGIRHQEIRTKAYAAANGKLNAYYDESATTPVFGAVFKASDKVSLYANHIEGLAKGPIAPGGVTNANEAFPPGRSKQTEAGVKVDMGTYGATLGVFQIEQPATSGYTDPGTNTFSIVGEQRNRGIELNLFGEPVRGLRLLSGVTFIDAELTRTNGGLNDGNTAVGVPDYYWTMGVDWDLPMASGMSLQAQLLRAGTQYVDPANNLKLPTWTRIDLGARYATRIDGHNVVWRAGVENVADRAYWASANGGYLTQGAPRTYKLAMSVDF